MVIIVFRCTTSVRKADIAGPLKPAENGDVYHITYINDFTGYLFAYSLPDKTALGVLNSFWHFQAMSERAFACKIQVLRTDGGNEYKDVMRQYLLQSGIIQQVTTPYIPQLNGRAERMNRTIKEMLASMLIDAKIGMRYWNFGLKYALAIWNTGRVLDGVTLEEKVHKRRVEYSKIQPFGAECWVRVPPETRRKADLTVPKAWKGKLLSIHFPGSGYIVQLDADEKPIISCDVVSKRVIEDDGSLGDSRPPIDEFAVPATAAAEKTELPAVPVLDTENAAPGGEKAAAPEPVVPDPPRRSPRFVGADAEGDNPLAFPMEDQPLHLALVVAASEADSDLISYRLWMKSKRG